MPSPGPERVLPARHQRSSIPQGWNDVPKHPSSVAKRSLGAGQGGSLQSQRNQIGRRLLDNTHATCLYASFPTCPLNEEGDAFIALEGRTDTEAFHVREGNARYRLEVNGSVDVFDVHSYAGCASECDERPLATSRHVEPDVRPGASHKEWLSVRLSADAARTAHELHLSRSDTYVARDYRTKRSVSDGEATLQRPRREPFLAGALLIIEKIEI